MHDSNQTDLLFLGHIPVFLKLLLLFLHAFLTSLWTTKKITKRMMRLFRAGQPINSYLPEHESKHGTPSMGGIGIVTGIILPSFFWLPLTATLIWGYVTLMAFAGIGALDDITKLHQKKNKGIAPKFKFFLQISCAAIITLGITFYAAPHVDPYMIQVPLFLNWSISSPYLYVPFIIFIMTATSNAANLTDGLDGLATKVITPIFYTVAIFAFIAGYSQYAQLYSIIYIPQAQDIMTLAIVACGSCTGFLWFNKPRATIFMGDTGSMALGALLAFCFIVIKMELLLPIAAFIMLFETLSVIIQVAAYRFNKKRLFLFAPYHHHLEKKGWGESTIVFRLGILSDLCCLLALFVFFLHAYVNALPS